MRCIASMSLRWARRSRGVIGEGLKRPSLEDGMSPKALGCDPRRRAAAAGQSASAARYQPIFRGAWRSDRRAAWTVPGYLWSRAKSKSVIRCQTRENGSAKRAEAGRGGRIPREVSVTYLKAMIVGLTLAVVFQVVATVCEFAVKYAFSVAVSGGVGGSPGASMAIPSPVSVGAAVAGFVYGFRKVARSVEPGRRALNL